MQDFNNKLNEKTQEIEDVIYSYLPNELNKQKVIMEAMNYSVKAGGKRLRPMLMFETSKLFDKDCKNVYPFMAAIEFIHTYSLVHDDLPAMDNDEYRRGRKTTHAEYGEDLGILAGDGLLNYAYEIMTKAVLESEDPYKAIRAMNVIATKAGIYGMVGGQTVDVISEGKKIDLDTIMYIHNLKTAALIEASMMAGAILAGATQTQIDTVENIANNVGIAFQIQDDILDIISTTEKLGKPVLSDEKNDKTTYVSLCGLEKAKDDVKKMSSSAVELLDTLDEKNEFLKALIIKLINREK